MTANHNAKGALAGQLNALLADLFALYVKTKSFHWHVHGPNFRDLHLLFDEQAAELFALTDTVAERVRKNGADTLTSIGAIGTNARIRDQDSTALDARSMALELRRDNEGLIAALRELKASAAAANDNATEGMADDWTDQAERRVWFLSAVAA